MGQENVSISAPALFVISNFLIIYFQDEQSCTIVLR